MQTNKDWIEAGTWIGRQQTFAVIAKHSLGAQAACLRHIKETRQFEKMGLNWADFCVEHAGMSRTRADDLIARHQEFGDSFFQVSQIASVSPETYRKIEDNVHGEVIDIEGEEVPLTPENAPKIRAAIRKLASAAVRADRITRKEFRMRIDLLSSDIDRNGTMSQTADELAFYREIVDYACQSFAHVADSLGRLHRPEKAAP